MLEILKDTHDDEHGVDRRYFLASVESIEQLPAIIQSVPQCFLLFLAVDATAIPDSELRRAAKSLLEKGMVYLCAWGPDCERVHDQFDQECIEVEKKNNFAVDRVIMTTWHSKDSLTKAVWFFEYCAFPAEGFQSDKFGWVVVSVGNKAWDSKIRAKLLR